MFRENRRQIFTLLLLAIIGMVAFVSLLGTFTTGMEALQVELGLQIFDRGYTQLEIPPLGRVRAQTHLPPLMLKVRLDNINLQQLQELMEHTDDEAYLANLQDTARRKIEIFIARLLALAFIGGFAGPFFFGIRERKQLIAAGLIGIIVLGSLLAGAYFSYQPLAFMNPEFEGILKAAPWLFGILEEALFSVQTLGEQLELVAVSINSLFQQVERLEPLGTTEGDLKVVHVSDLHNNPAGIDFLRQVIDTFNVHMVIDTGDITDFGTEIEAALADPIEEFGIPYIFVPGNHDSPGVIERMKTLANVTVLEEAQIEVLGLRIAGIVDPSAGDSGMVVAVEPVLDEYARRLEKLIKKSGQSPHIVAAHHPRIASFFLPQIPVVLTGHLHRYDIRVQSGSVMINAGTTGAAGIRGLQTGQETPYSLVLLHFGLRSDGELYLKAADTIHVYQLRSGFSLERRLFGSTASEHDLEAD
ncbi:MAG TPA: metallophosphoesterase [Oscillospiraceae bacterium]|nr:metallophosphoesterase [Oscillospiraceae bacterium]